MNAFFLGRGKILAHCRRRRFGLFICWQNHPQNISSPKPRLCMDDSHSSTHPLSHSSITSSSEETGCGNIIIIRIRIIITSSGHHHNHQERQVVGTQQKYSPPRLQAACAQRWGSPAWWWWRWSWWWSRRWWVGLAMKGKIVNRIMRPRKWAVDWLPLSQSTDFFARESYTCYGIILKWKFENKSCLDERSWRGFCIQAGSNFCICATRGDLEDEEEEVKT